MAVFNRRLEDLLRWGYPLNQFDQLDRSSMVSLYVSMAATGSFFSTLVSTVFYSAMAVSVHVVQTSWLAPYTSSVLEVSSKTYLQVHLCPKRLLGDRSGSGKWRICAIGPILLAPQHYAQLNEFHTGRYGTTGGGCRRAIPRRESVANRFPAGSQHPRLCCQYFFVLEIFDIPT